MCPPPGRWLRRNRCSRPGCGRFRHAGAGAGVMSTAVQIGNALGVAVIGIIFYSPLGAAAAYAHALLASVMYLILIGLTLALLVQFLPRHRAR
jgi:predicted MFS family arabinose efflux permease